MANPIVGSLYFDAQTYTHMIYTGKAWVKLDDRTSSMIGNNYTITEEEVLIAKHPGLAELKRELDEAKEKYAAFYALCKE